MWNVRSQGSWSYSGGSREWKTDGFYVHKYEGTGTAFETVARPKEGVWLWPTKEEAQAVADRLNKGEELDLVYASYSND